MTTALTTPTLEQYNSKIAELELELEQSNDEWETASKSDRYWIGEAMDDLEAKISRYKAKRRELYQA